MVMPKRKMSAKNNRVNIDISRNSEFLEGEPSDEKIRETIAYVAEQLGSEDSEISLRIVDKEEMLDLNQKYRDRGNSTNVLSFPAELDFQGIDFLGDIVICNRVVRSEAVSFEMNYADRYRHMLVHATLHLLGYDHQEENEQLNMEELEKKIALDLKIGNPYE